MQDHDEFYRTLCSSETLRSGRKGFFHDFSDFVTQTAGDTWTSSTFGRIDDDEERVRAVFTDARIRDVVVDTLAKVKPLYRDKDAEISRCRRLEGHQHAAVGQYDKALLLLSQAVLRAPQSGCYLIKTRLFHSREITRNFREPQRDRANNFDLASTAHHRRFSLQRASALSLSRLQRS